MSKKIVAVNASPRKGWNTDTIITEAAKGAESAGAVVEKFDLFKLEKYTGCISCFGCKKEKFKGHCICRDGLTPVLDAIRENDLYPDIIFACGPIPMLRALAAWAEGKDIPCYISLEERMACGIGACLGCVCKTKETDEHTHVHNRRICKEGPVFLSTEVEL